MDKEQKLAIGVVCLVGTVMVTRRKRDFAIKEIALVRKDNDDVHLTVTPPGVTQQGGDTEN